MPRRTSSNAFAEFSEPPAERCPALFEVIENPVRPDRGAVGAVVQRAVDHKVGQPALTYAHYWAAWELLRRSQKQFEIEQAPVRPAAIPDAILRNVRTYDELRATLREWDAEEVADPMKFGTGASLRFPRGYRFPLPREDLSAPTEPHDDAWAAQALMNHLRLSVAPAVIVGMAVPFGAPQPSEEFVELFVHRDATDTELKLALAALRATVPSWQRAARRRRVPHRNDIWGARYSPVEAIELVDWLAAEKPLRTWVRRVQRRHAPSASEAAHTDDHEAAYGNARDLRHRLLSALRDNPLAPISRRAPRRR